MRAVKGSPMSEHGVEVVDIEEPSGEGLLVSIRSVGICGTDLLYLRLGSRQVLGHEIAGVLEDGTAVAVEPAFGCGSCELCEEGSFNLCRTSVNSLLGLNAPGAMSERFRAPERAVRRLPTTLDPLDASLVEPASVALHAAHLALISPDCRVAIVGGGAIGILSVVMASSLGAAELALEARHEPQRLLGEEFGAVGPPQGLYDVVLEASGSESGLHRAVELARPQGRVVLIGAYSPKVTWPSTEAMFKELTVRTSIGYCAHEGRREFDEAAELIASTPRLASALLTHRFGLDDAPAAFATARDRSQGVFRVVVHPS
jgi:2-desacetyl-2-hydroxyethyl bacteriochlorophyllide A dehydrogenase